MTTDIQPFQTDIQPFQPLILGVEKPIWLATTGPLEETSSEIIGWTTKEPEYNNGYIDKGSVLLFTNIPPEKDTRGQQPLEFIITHVGPVPGEYPTDFLEEEIDSLTKEGVFTLLRLENIDEVSIGLGQIFIKYKNYIAGRNLSFDTRVFSPRHLTFTMDGYFDEIVPVDVYPGEYSDVTAKMRHNYQKYEQT
jgi:hypothetical protein